MDIFFSLVSIQNLVGIYTQTTSQFPSATILVLRDHLWLEAIVCNTNVQTGSWILSGLTFRACKVMAFGEVAFDLSSKLSS